jgi:hypothetical protein
LDAYSQRRTGQPAPVADQWYELNNVDSAAAAISVSFTTERTDFPPNLTELRIERIALYFPHAADQLFTVTVDDLTFKPRGGAAIAGGPA